MPNPVCTWPPVRRWCRLVALLWLVPAMSPVMVFGQDEPETKENILPREETESEKTLVEQEVWRFALRLGNEVSFLLPEGEFELTLEKRFGNFLTQTNARYNFVRGEIGFSLRHIYTRYRIVPQVQVYDRLNFVPLFSRDRFWRREQGVQLGGRFFARVPLATFTSYNYERLSFPSSVNVQSLESQAVHSVAQAFSGRVDSLFVMGFHTSGLFELELAKTLPLGTQDFDYWQLRFSATGAFDRGLFSLQGRFRLVSLLAGENAPPQFLGGRNKLSAFDSNEFSGINLLYASATTQLRLKREPVRLPLNLFASAISVSSHFELGQVGDESRMRDPRSYHASVGIGIDSIAAYRRSLAFEVFAFWYHGLEPGRESRYYVGIKF